MVASEIMGPAAALLNDRSLAIFTYDAQTPYLNIALTELDEEFQLNNVPTTNETSSYTLVGANQNGIGGGNGQPNLPVDLVEPLSLWEQQLGNEVSFTPMKRVDFLPVNHTQTSNLIYWTWQTERIKFIEFGANLPIVIRINYVRSLFKSVQNQNSEIFYSRGKSYLTYRTAALCAEFIGENKTRSDELNGFAGLALQRVLGIATKPKQSVTTRRRPFMAGFRSRRILT